MSRQAVQFYKLREEADRLRDRVEQLQLQLETETSAVAVAAPPVPTVPVAGSAEVWNVWPYSWASTGWGVASNFCRERVHSFHENREYQKLCRENRRRLTPQWGADTMGSETLRLV